MTKRKNFNTSKVARMSQVFPQAVIADKFIFLSGMPGLDLASGTIISNDFEDQTRQCFLNIKNSFRRSWQQFRKSCKNNNIHGNR